MPVQIRLHGTPLDVVDESLASYGITQQQCFKTSGIRRGLGYDWEFTAGEDEVLKIEFENGYVDFVRVEDLKTNATRSADGGRVDLTAYSPEFAKETRGLIGWVTKRITQFVFKPVAGLAAHGIIRSLERTSFLTNNQEPGVYQVNEDFTMKKLAAKGAVDDLRMRPEQPYLVLIHGTFSNARDAFKGFRTVSSKGELTGQTPEWIQLYKQYSGRVLALEHKTLSVNPVTNAIDFGELLPERARLHLISHSRGGLIGDLLSLPEFTPEQEECFLLKRGGKNSTQATTEMHDIRKLLSLREERKWCVEKFVRVASPSRGTILAGQRLDDFVKRFFNLAKLVPALTASPTLMLAEAL